MHERQFDWLTHALPLEKLNILQLLPQAKHETQHTGTEPQFSSAKDDVTPFKVNGDPSTLTDQRIPTCSCESPVTVLGTAALMPPYHSHHSENADGERGQGGAQKELDR